MCRVSFFLSFFLLSFFPSFFLSRLTQTCLKNSRIFFKVKPKSASKIMVKPRRKSFKKLCTKKNIFRSLYFFENWIFPIEIQPEISVAQGRYLIFFSNFFNFSKLFDFFESVQKGPKWSQKCLKCTKRGFGLFVGCPRAQLGVKEGRSAALVWVMYGHQWSIFRKFSIFVKVYKKVPNGLKSV